MIQQSPDVVGHARAVIGGRFIEFARGAVTTIIERDDPAAGSSESGDPARMNPVHFGGRGETVHKHDRRPLAFRLVGLDQPLLGEIVEDRGEPFSDKSAAVASEDAPVAVGLRQHQCRHRDLVEKRIDRFLAGELLGLLGRLLGIARQEPLIKAFL